MSNLIRLIKNGKPVNIQIISPNNGKVQYQWYEIKLIGILNRKKDYRPLKRIKIITNREQNSTAWLSKNTLIKVVDTLDKQIISRS